MCVDDRKGSAQSLATQCRTDPALHLALAPSRLCPSFRKCHAALLNVHMPPRCLAVAHGRHLLLCTASPERPPPAGALGAAELVPSVESITFHLVGATCSA